MSRRTDVLAAVALVALSLSVPAALAAWLLAGPDELHAQGDALALAPPVEIADGIATRTMPGSPPSAGSGAGPARRPVTVIGMLYTRGTASVDWKGVEIPVENGTYAYVGGETVAIGPDSMGVLRLADGSSVFLCPDSRARLEIIDGTVALDMLAGSGRFVFQPGRDFTVDAGGVTIAAPGIASEPLAGEVVVPEAGGCVLCALHGTLSVAGAPTARAGSIVRVAPGGSASTGDIPGAFAAAFAAEDLARAGAGDLPFLCRCREIDRYALGQGQEAPAGLAPPGGGTAVPAAPPVEPPGLPSIALAVPGAPSPFDPNLLPPPAAGPGTTTFTVPPPLVPTGGTGGGGSASPS